MTGAGAWWSGMWLWSLVVRRRWPNVGWWGGSSFRCLMVRLQVGGDHRHGRVAKMHAGEAVCEYWVIGGGVLKVAIKAYGLSRVCSPELLEVQDAEALLAFYRVVSISVFSYVMTFNNKKVCAIFGCHVTPCAQNQHHWFSKYSRFRNI